MGMGDAMISPVDLRGLRGPMELFLRSEEVGKTHLRDSMGL